MKHFCENLEMLVLLSASFGALWVKSKVMSHHPVPNFSEYLEVLLFYLSFLLGFSLLLILVKKNQKP